MKITFISIFPDTTAFGLRSVAAHVSKNGFETQLIFLPDPDFDKLRTKAERSGYAYPDAVMEQLEPFVRGSAFVGISVFTSYFRQAVQLSKRLKELKIPVLWGGKHPSAMPEESLRYADMVCVGEGEDAILELAQKMQRGEDYSATQNFWFASSKGIIKNQLRPIAQDIDQFPVPDYTFCPHFVWLKEQGTIVPMTAEIVRRFLLPDPFGKETDGRVYLTMMTRGCPYSCTYCYTFKDFYKGQQYVRQRSVESVISELEIIKATYGFVTHISLSDDEFFALKYDKIKEFAEKFKARIGLHLSCLVSPASVSKEKMDLLIDAGLCIIQMGIQTASDNGKRIYRRNISNEKVMAAIEILNTYKDKVIPLYDFIIDNPYETNEDVLQTLRFILQIPKPYHLDIFSLTFFPGTELYKKAVADGLIGGGEEDYVKVYKAYKGSYLNLMFLLINYRFPRSVIRVLISRPLVFVFERKMVNRLLFLVIDMLRRIKLLRLFKKLQILNTSKE